MFEAKYKSNYTKALGTLLFVGILMVGAMLTGIAADKISHASLPQAEIESAIAVTLWSQAILGTDNNTRKIPNTSVASAVDFETRILSVGYITRDGTFIRTNELPQGKKGAVQFSITNIGNITSPIWEYNAKLPTFPFHTYESGAQKHLDPGETRTYVLTFDNVVTQDTHGIEINADPTGAIEEMTEENNIARADISFHVPPKGD